MVFSAHKQNAVRKQGHRNGGSGFVFPCPHGHDRNPIEMTFSKLKAFLKKRGRNQERPAGLHWIMISARAPEQACPSGRHTVVLGIALLDWRSRPMKPVLVSLGEHVLQKFHFLQGPSRAEHDAG